MNFVNGESEQEPDNSIIRRKRKCNEYPPDTYFEEQYRMLNMGIIGKKESLYNQAIRMEIAGAYELENLTPDNQLNRIKGEINIRIKITALEAFKIGLLFLLAKSVCRTSGHHFKDWLQESFNISYETANNYMNVYKNCLGMMSIAVKLPLSVLYKLSAPNFPDELRQWLFTECNLEKITNIEVENIKADYLEGGYEAIRERVETWNMDLLLYRQTRFVLDRCKGINLDLSNLSKQIRQKELLPEASEIHERLRVAIYEASGIIGRAIDESESRLFDRNCDMLEALEV